MDTIFAPATAKGAAGVAVLRVSGPEAANACTQIAGGLPEPRKAVLRRLRDAAGATIDHGLILWFPQPESFTGEDVVEFHVHGGRAVIGGLCEVLGGIAGLRPAEAGEFTRRGFINGRFDLTAAEGIADLVAAETAAQRRQALRQMEGGLAALYDRWRGALIGMLAHAEAVIDFVDEDLPEDVQARMQERVSEIAAEIGCHLGDFRRGERLRDGVLIALVGAPNAGKSSLMNRLAQRDVAIVAETAGTTRDVIEARLDIGGYAVTVADTAGLRGAAEGVEAEGIRRAHRMAENADIVLHVTDATDMNSEPAGAIGADERVILVRNKTDLIAGPTDRGGDGVAISCLTGDGIEDLLGQLVGRLEGMYGGGTDVLPTRERHRAGLTRAHEALKRFRTAGAPELEAEELRRAVREIGRITGRVDVEDILDRIFSDFCIGK
ncbi:MAG: tRNA uridine-5-carboxymethylaminomethyl(34) synthesis GTPase MnmE [Rhodospirillaceae bacterium]|nr:tRNA uridine-5-carboxymethylaminomethyl(34) synthesis GTPase MnmE [Rhodospirillaceae bacterium]